MVWTAETSKDFEARKVRDRIAGYLKGVILDIGCGTEKVCAEAIGVDATPGVTNLTCDLSHPDAMRFFGDESADVVFSSHFLEDIIDYKRMLREFMRVLKVDGVLILYLPHRDLYPNIGEYGANLRHKHDFIPEDIISALPGTFRVERNEIRDQDDEYSFELIVRKISSLNHGQIEYESRRHDNSVVVVRYGGFGDMAIVSPVFRILKEQGKYVIANCSVESKFVLRGNPYIDEFITQSRYAIPTSQLGDYFDSMRKEYGEVINLCESVERSLLLEKDKDPDLYNLSHDERHKRFNVNYSERTLSMAGLSGGAKPEIYLTESEEILCRGFQRCHSDTFNLLWQVNGSSWHKMFPYSSDVIDELLDEIPDMKVFITGGENAYAANWGHKRLQNRIRQWDARQSMIITKYMDCVVSPETGVLNAAGAFDTPKIGLLTHSSKENLTKYFVNDYSIQSEAPCSPCHRLIHDLSECPVDDTFGLPICMSRHMDPEKVKTNIREIYSKWKSRR